MTAALWGAVACGLLMPVAMIACYPVLMHHSRHEPNRWSGYRTDRALGSTRAWRVAQAMCARHWVRIGALFAALTLAGYGALYVAGSRDPDTWWWMAALFAILPLVGIGWSTAVIEKTLDQIDVTGGAGPV